jgi:hypothetical protein
MLVHSPKKMTFAVRGKGGLWGVAVLLAGLTGCGSSSSKCGTNCKTDGSVDDKQQPIDAPFDRALAQDTGTVEKQDAQVDAPRDVRTSVDLGPGCDQSIAVACAAGAASHDAGAFSIHCASSWAGTTGNSYFCGRPEILLQTCGDDRQLIDTSNTGSSEYIYIYDGAGALYAITYSAGGPTSHCVAGPEAGFVDPVGCGTSMLFSCPADAGRHG